MIAAGPIPGLGPMELILILAVVIIIFGVGRLPEIGGAIGKGIREFRKATKEPDSPPQIGDVKSQPAAQEPTEVTCPTCGIPNAVDSKFCKSCGSSVRAATS